MQKYYYSSTLVHSKFYRFLILLIFLITSYNCSSINNKFTNNEKIQKKELRKKYYKENFSEEELNIVSDLENLESNNCQEYFSQLWQFRFQNQIKNSSNNSFKSQIDSIIGRSFIQKITEIEKSNFELKKYINKSDLILDNYLRRNCDYDIYAIKSLINLYYCDHRVTPHAQFLKILNKRNKDIFLNFINISRKKIGLDSLITSLEKSIFSKNFSEIELIFDFLFPNVYDVEDNFLKKILGKLIHTNDLNLLKRFIAKFPSFNLYYYCLLESIYSNSPFSFKFISQNLDIQKIKIRGRNLLQEAILQTIDNKIPFYIFKSKNINPLEIDDNNLNSFFYAAKKDMPHLFLRMMEYCNFHEDINNADEKSDDQNSPIFYLLKNCNKNKNCEDKFDKYLQIIDLMINKNILNINSNSAKNLSLLHQVISYNNFDLTKKFIDEYEADIFLESNDHETALIHALEVKASKEIIDFLIKKSGNFMKPNSQGNTPLVFDISRLNLKYQNINEDINNNESILFYLISNSDNKANYKKLVEIFDNHPNSIDFSNKSKENNSILHHLAMMDHKKLKPIAISLTKLNKNNKIFNKIDLYSENNSKETPMDITISRKNLTMMELLFTMNYDFKRRNLNSLQTFLHNVLENATYRRSNIFHQIDSDSKYMIHFLNHNYKNYFKNALFLEDFDGRTPLQIFNKKINDLIIKESLTIKMFRNVLDPYKDVDLWNFNFWIYRIKKGSLSIQEKKNYNSFQKKLDSFIGNSFKTKIKKAIVSIMTLFFLSLFILIKLSNIQEDYKFFAVMTPIYIGAIFCCFGNPFVMYQMNPANVIKFGICFGTHGILNLYFFFFFNKYEYLWISISKSIVLINVLFDILYLCF